MKKNSVKRNYSDSDDKVDAGKRSSVAKSKISKKRLSIYDEYEDDDDIYPHHEKFKNRRK